MRFCCISILLLLGCPALLLADAILRGRVVDAETGRPDRLHRDGACRRR